MKSRNQKVVVYLFRFVFILVGLFLLAVMPASLKAQEQFTLEIVPTSIYGLPPLHSYAHAQYDGKWLILGGQTSEDEAFSHANLEIIVVDPLLGKVWMMPSEELYQKIPSVEQLTSCYAQYYQDEGTFYLLGGYGYSPEYEGYLTFPYMTVIDLKGAISHIISGDFEQAGQYFRQVQDDYFGVMEGMLTKVKDEFYLVGGIEFFGFFDEENPLFSKVPRRDILKFKLSKDKYGDYQVKYTGNYNYSEEFDEILPTYVPQVSPDGREGFSIYSNEALEGQDFASWLDVFEVGHSVSWQRNAKIPHYHSTIIPVYDKKSKLMHTLFLGGCDDFLCDTEDVYGSLPEVDSVLQFTKKEYLPNEMVQKKIKPFSNFGRDAKFLLNEKIPSYKNGVIKLNKLGDEKTLIGFIYGGASAVNPMIFQNGDILALATDQVFMVYLNKIPAVEIERKEDVKTKPDID